MQWNMRLWLHKADWLQTKHWRAMQNFWFFNILQCVSLTVPNTLPCKCINLASYDLIKDSCQCESNAFEYNSMCYPCVRWLKSFEIFASFSSTFLQVKFVFSISVHSTTCELVFDSKTLKKFGSGYLCLFSRDNTQLIVTLGYDFTLQNEIVSLNSSYLYGTANECGHFKTDLETTIFYPFPLPEPSAVIVVPSIVYYECQDLVIDEANRMQDFQKYYINEPFFCQISQVLIS